VPVWLSASKRGIRTASGRPHHTKLNWRGEARAGIHRRPTAPERSFAAGAPSHYNVDPCDPLERVIQSPERTLGRHAFLGTEQSTALREHNVARIKQTLAEGGSVRLFGVGQVFHPKIVEIVGEHGGFDGLWIDQEHAGLTLREIELAVLAARNYGLDHFVRLPATDYASIMRPLEVGAGGVMVSMARSVEEAEQAVRWAKFWPRGERGMNGGNRDGRFGLTPLAEYAEQANAATFVGIQIETPGAIASAAEIAAVPDVDLLFVGPADLSQILGVPGQFNHPKCLETIDRIAEACRDAGKPWGIVTRGEEHARHMAERGCRMFVLGFDTLALHEGIRAIKARYENLVDATSD